MDIYVTLLEERANYEHQRLRVEKWDLHVHTPDTKMENNYKIRDIPKEYIKITKEKYANYIKNNENTLEDKDFLWLYWIDIIHNSDVEVIGVTDYFSLNQYINAMKYYDLYLNINNIRVQKNINRKIFFPNMELRAPHTVNRSHKYINFHFVFNPDKMSREIIDDILGDIKIKFGIDRKEGTKSLKYITSKNAEDVTVELDTAIDVLTNIFGEYFEDSVKIITSGKKDGLTTNGLESSRNMKILDGHADITDGIFSMTPNDREHWLEKGKPTFGGSDAHSFPNLLKKLGKHGKILHENGDTKESWKTTWVKAESTFEGFKQVFIEPDERVKIQEQEPDSKSNYAWIKEVQFDAPGIFPEKIVLNRNLNSIIGSRSSGKSALLGYISQAVDYVPDRNTELAAGISWEEAADMKCSVLWADGDKTTHELNESQKSVIYIPQNHLFNIASDPERVTSTIQKTLYTVHSESKKKIDLFDSNEKQYREDIRRILDKYFELVAKFEDLQSQKKEYPALSTLEEEYRIQESELIELRRQNQLSEEESKLLNTLKERFDEINNEISKYSNYSLAQQPIVDKSGILTSVRIPDNSNPNMKVEIDNYLRGISDAISIKVAQVYDEYNKINKNHINELKNELKRIDTNNRDIIKNLLPLQH